MTRPPEIPSEAVTVIVLAERLLAVLHQEAALIGPGLAKDISGLLQEKDALAEQLAAALPALAEIELAPEVIDHIAALDEDLRAAASNSEKALQSTLDSTVRIVRRLSDIAGRKARPAAYGPTGALKDQNAAPGALPFEKKV